MASDSSWIKYGVSVLLIIRIDSKRKIGDVGIAQESPNSSGLFRVRFSDGGLSQVRAKEVEPFVH